MKILCKNSCVFENKHFSFIFIFQQANTSIQSNTYDLQILMTYFCVFENKHFSFIFIFQQANTSMQSNTYKLHHSLFLTVPSSSFLAMQSKGFSFTSASNLAKSESRRLICLSTWKRHTFSYDIKKIYYFNLNARKKCTK